MAIPTTTLILTMSLAQTVPQDGQQARSMAQAVVPTNANAVVVSGLNARGRMPLASMGLGDGGVTTVRGKLQVIGRGKVRTPGGVVVHARAEGVKLTFPSKQELLITPAGRIHLRTLEMTLQHLSGVQLLLTDGSKITARRGTTGTQPLTSVEVAANGKTHRIWNSRATATNASHAGRFPGVALLALGDGRMLYRATPLGPLVVLERVLCPKIKARHYARVRVVVSGDILKASLRRLPDHAPRKSVQFPQVREAARKLAMLAPSIFPARPMPRPAGAVGELVFSLGIGFRLKIAAADHRCVIGLYKGATATPGVEWVVGGRTELYFVRPSASSPGYRGPRYYLRGLDLRREVENLLPGYPAPRDQQRARKLIQALGGRAPKLLPVRRG